MPGPIFVPSEKAWADMAPFPLRLQLLDEVGGAGAAGDQEPGLADLEDRPRDGRFGRGQGRAGRGRAAAEHVDPFPADPGKNPGLIGQGEDLAVDGFGRLRPVEAAVLLADLRGERGQGAVLLQRGDPVEIGQGRDEETRAQDGQAGLQG